MKNLTLNYNHLEYYNMQIKTSVAHRHAFIALLCCLFISLINTQYLQAKEASLKNSRPNIIYVLTDDQGMGDLSYTGNTILQTPHLDKFAESATRFTDFQVSPTCAPSRAAIMSGRRPFEVGVTHTVLHRERMALDVTTFPQLLQKAGYKTALFGKWHLGDKGEYLPQKRGFDEVLMHGAGGIGQALGDFKVNRKNTYFDNVLLHNNTVVQTEGFCTDLFFTSALSWIKKQHEEKQPYFAYVSLNAPHAPAIAPEHYKRKFMDQGYDERSASRYGMVENIDDNFGHMMQQLKTWGALENTLVIFMTDNGMTMPAIKKKGVARFKPFNAGMKGGKNSPWEGGSHIPSFWYWNGVLAENTDINALTSHIDLYRTFTDLAGVNIPESKLPPVGRSLLPLLENSEATWPDRKLFVHKGRWDDGRKNKMTREENQYNGAAIRTEQWRLVYSLDKKGKLETYLSDVMKDPGETTNLAVKFPKIVSELKASYDIWWHSTEPFLINDKLPKVKSNTKSFNEKYNEQLKGKGIPNWKPTLPIRDFKETRL